jgi:hypothetical protein
MAQILEHHGPLDESVLAEHERAWGFKLPADYRAFLLRYNGGYPDPDVFRFKDSTKGSSVDRFLGIHGREHNNLLTYLKLYEGRVPANLFPVAHDPGGNLILVSTSGPDFGRIYFWDHELEADEGEEPGYSNVTPIADGFDDFVNNLKEYSPPAGPA